jgi:hypothetical protein
MAFRNENQMGNEMFSKILWGVYFLGLLIMNAIICYQYGTASRKDKKSNYFAMVPVASVIWPMLFVLAPFVFVGVKISEFGERRSKNL